MQYRQLSCLLWEGINLQKIYRIIITVTGILLLLTVILVLLAKLPVRGSLYQDQITSLEFGWHDSNGLEIDLMHLHFDENQQAIISIQPVWE